MFKVFIVVTFVALAFGKDLPQGVTFADNPVIQIDGGLIQGELLSSGLFSNYFSFKGIPYAEPPVGDRRFRAPVRHGGWDGVRTAFEHGNSCPSSSILGGPGGDEDCLFLNVYTPDFTPGRAVMVWIHGGSFSGGSGDSWVYGPEHLLGDDVLLVTINYRLGVLGFLSTGDSNAPGNYGMKDMVLALQWVRDNIAAFGGDPDNVTIFGESAGGAAVHYLLLSQKGSGLFTKAISQSGSALNPWAFQHDPATVAWQLARDLSITASTTEELVAALRNVEPSELVRATPGALAYIIPRGLRPIPFVPCQDPPSISADEVFLPDLPINIMRSGSFNQVPYITGYTDAESLFLIRELLLDPSVFPTINANPELMIPFNWNIPPGSAAAQSIVSEIRNFYFEGQTLADDIRWDWTRYNTDLMFAHGIDRTARLHAERQIHPVYYYKFSFDGDLNLMKTLLMLGQYPGAVHADDIFYLFHVTSIPPPLLPTNDAIMTRRRMVRLWTNFARLGHPTGQQDIFVVNVNWIRVLGAQEFLDIGTNLEFGRAPLTDRMALWNRLMATYAPNV